MTRLVEVAVAGLTKPLHTEFVTALRRTGFVYSMAIRLTDSDGVVGFGEAPQIWRVTGESLASIEACVLGPLADALLGLELSDAAEVAAVLDRTVAGNTGARAACEIAAHDLAARRTGQSLAASLGAHVPDVATDVTMAAATAPGAVDQAPSGFSEVKIKVGLDPDDVARVIRIHQNSVVPLAIRVDANQAWDVATASAAVESWLRAGVDLGFLEQPLPAWDLAGLAELRRRVPVPIVVDESVFSIHDLRRTIDADAADIVNIKLAKCGGLRPGLAIAELAKSAGLGLMVGSMMESELGVSAAAALAARIAPDQTHDLDAAWWSIDPHTDPGTPYRGAKFALADTAGLTSAVARIGGDLGDWLSRS
jgi:L-alanine-DL-glutamate epimerase and related enzymes of enolase superfamily